ncbi:MAG: PD-(D/E)XK nuclease family protein, partial [Solirubrobacteraceae bacterium]|nr:PD-(D/E)XK nuclease family protein [Solirubrobacteraceae bacterium]
RLMRERVVAEVEATIPGLCGDRRLAHQPIEFELPFGTRQLEDDDTPEAGVGAGDDEEADDTRPPVVVERAGERLTLAGRIDRLDHDPHTGELVIVDYKGANVDPFKGAGWLEGRELQAGLYALAAEELVGGGTKTVASLYQPVPGPASQPPRGATSTDLEGRGGVLRNDRLAPDVWDELLDALVRLAADAQRGIDDGVITPEPQRCTAGGCRFPWLCRGGQA